MQVGFAGLGRMGSNMARRVLERGGGQVQVVVFNRSPGPIRELEAEGAIGAYSLDELASKLTERPRIVWSMLPAGQVTDAFIEELAPRLSRGDIVVDGGNSYYKDDLRRAQALEERGLEYLDAGTSGGIWGRTVGYAVMVGGKPEAYEHVEPYLRLLAPPEGYGLVGPHGAGHFSKMVHNGIEYGLMQAYAEGLQILEQSPFPYDLQALCRLWNHGSVIRSWLLELAEGAFAEDPNLEQIRGWVEDTGEGRWTILSAIDEGVPAPVITAALYSRFYSRDANSFSHRVLAALRNAFGGHAVKPAD